MSKQLLNVENAISYVTNYWPYRSGFVLAAFVLIALETPLLVGTDATFLQSILFITVTVAILFAVWYRTTQPPKTKKGKIGFAVSIACSTEDEEIKISEDFISTLRLLVKSGSVGNSFDFLQIPQHIAKTIVDPEAAHALRLKCKTHFLLYGRVRVRSIDNKDYHFIELEGVISHKEVPYPVKQKLVTEFTELLPRKVNLSTENDLLTFQFTAEWADLVAKYIIGIAAAMSGAIDYAEILFDEVLNKLKSKPTDFPVFEKLKERIPIRISEINEARAQASYEYWVESHDDEAINRLGEFLSKIDESQLNRKSLIYLRSIFAFLEKRDTSMAERQLNTIRKSERDAIWHYNIGFLRAYEGDLKSSIRHYRQAASLPNTPDLLSKIEDFLCYIAQLERDKYQLYFCLGFFNWKSKGDTVQAVNDFQTFIDLGLDAEFVKERQLASDWINEIESRH